MLLRSSTTSANHVVREIPPPPCTIPRDSFGGQKADQFGRWGKLLQNVVLASNNYTSEEEGIRELNVISVSNWVVQWPPQTTGFGVCEEGHSTDPTCHGPGSVAVVMRQHLARNVTLSSLPVQEQALSKSTKGTGFAEHEIISKPCLSHISRCVEGQAGQCKGITGIL